MSKIYFEVENDSLKMININDILKTIKNNCYYRPSCKGCKYLNNDTLRCKFRDIPRQWEIE